MHELIPVIAIIVILVAATGIIKYRKSNISLEKRWKNIQKLLINKSTWRDAITQADDLLDEILKKRHFKGKTMGERLVSAQHELSANEMVWFSHKLKNKLDSDPKMSLTKGEVKKSLLGIWQALKDLGAFNHE